MLPGVNSRVTDDLARYSSCQYTIHRVKIVALPKCVPYFFSVLNLDKNAQNDDRLIFS